MSLGYNKPAQLYLQPCCMPFEAAIFLKNAKNLCSMLRIFLGFNKRFGYPLKACIHAKKVNFDLLSVLIWYTNALPQLALSTERKPGLFCIEGSCGV